MKQLEFLMNLQLNPATQISPQLADQNTILFLNEDDNLEQRKKLITIYLAWHRLITTQGELEHANDWDPYLNVVLNDGTILGEEPGYDIAQIQSDNLLLEHPNEDGEAPGLDEDCYYTIPIASIHSLRFYY